MEIEVITLLKVPVKVVTFGGVTPSRIIKDPSSKPRELVLIITGNPGITSFYYRFANRVHEKTKLPVWIVSHGGHEQLPVPALKSHSDLYTLQGQTRQKQELIETYLKGIKLRCIGHSIGCKVISDLLRTSCSDQIVSSYMLFPTIERMAISTNGLRITFICNYVIWLLLFLTSIFNVFPRFFQNILLRVYCFVADVNPDNIPAITDVLEPRALKKILFLAYDEMKTVLQRDDDIIKKNVNKLRFYYGATDGWVPDGSFEDLKNKIPAVSAEVDSKGIFHSFVLNSSLEVGDIVSNWIEVDKELKG